MLRLKHFSYLIRFDAWFDDLNRSIAAPSLLNFLCVAVNERRQWDFGAEVVNI